jgi:hypothetical protein
MRPCALTVVASSGGVALTLLSLATPLTSLATTRHDQNLVFEAKLTIAANGGIGKRQCCEDGAIVATDDGLLPILPTFTSPVTANDTSFKFTASPGNNIRKMDSTTPLGVIKTLTPSTAASLAVLLTGGSPSGCSAPSGPLPSTVVELSRRVCLRSSAAVIGRTHHLL